MRVTTLRTPLWTLFLRGNHPIKTEAEAKRYCSPLISKRKKGPAWSCGSSFFSPSASPLLSNLPSTSSSLNTNESSNSSSKSKSSLSLQVLLPSLSSATSSSSAALPPTTSLSFGPSTPSMAPSFPFASAPPPAASSLSPRAPSPTLPWSSMAPPSPTALPHPSPPPSSAPTSTTSTSPPTAPPGPSSTLQSGVPSFSPLRCCALSSLLRSLSDSQSSSSIVDEFRYAMFCLLIFMCFGSDDEVDEEKIRQIMAPFGCRGKYCGCGCGCGFVTVC